MRQASAEAGGHAQAGARMVTSARAANINIEKEALRVVLRMASTAVERVLHEDVRRISIGRLAAHTQLLQAMAEGGRGCLPLQLHASRAAARCACNATGSQVFSVGWLLGL